MAKDEHGNLEPPPRKKSLDDPGAHDLGKDLHLHRNTRQAFDIDII
jgi:hypothetical protein